MTEGYRNDEDRCRQEARIDRVECSLVVRRESAACRAGMSSSAQVHRYGVPLFDCGGSRGGRVSN